MAARILCDACDKVIREKERDLPLVLLEMFKGVCVDAHIAIQAGVDLCADCREDLKKAIRRELDDQARF